MRAQFLALSAIFLAAPALAQDAQQPVRVQWSLDAERASTSDGSAHLTLIYHSNPKSQMISSSDLPLSELSGLDRRQLASGGRNQVRFSIVRNAGSLNCDGLAGQGRGSGDCVFQPDPAYAAGFARLGLGRLEPWQQYRLANREISLEEAGSLTRLKIPGLTVDGIVRLRNHNVTPEYIAELRQAGYDVDTESLVRLKKHGVTGNYVRQLAAQGIARMPAEELVRMRRYGVSPELIRATRDLGYRVGPEELVRLQRYGVSAGYLRDLADQGVRGLPVEDLVYMRRQGVSASFVGEARKLGYGHLSARDLALLHRHGIRASFLREAKEKAGGRPSAHDIIRLHDEDKV